MNYPSPAHCRLVVPCLVARAGIKTRVELSANRSVDVFNIAWGEDMGEEYEHITTNISPSIAGTDIGFFFTDEVAAIIDVTGGAVLWETDGKPNVR